MSSELKIEWESESKNRQMETETLAKKLADAMKNVENFKQKVCDANNEVSVLKRKNASSLRELTKELKDCQRKLENSTLHLRVASPLSASSRASSNSSLHKLANQDPESNSSSSNLSLASSETISNGYVRSNPQIQVNLV